MTRSGLHNRICWSGTPFRASSVQVFVAFPSENVNSSAAWISGHSPLILSDRVAVWLSQVFTEARHTATMNSDGDGAAAFSGATSGKYDLDPIRYHLRRCLRDDARPSESSDVRAGAVAADRFSRVRTMCASSGERPVTSSSPARPPSAANISFSVAHCSG